MKISINKKQFLFYVWTGIAYLLLWLLIDSVNYPGKFLLNVLNNLWRIIYIVFINLIFFEHAFPFILKTKNILYKILLFVLFLFVQMMLYSFGLYAWRYTGIQLNIYNDLKTYPGILDGVSHIVPYGIFSLFFFGIIKHVYEYQKLIQAAQQLRIQKQEAELNYLKSQTNPHFLFNTLNNIYSLARDKSDLAPESILRLSKILRFMLYETGGEYIAIEQEIKIISDYIALEKLRYDESLLINFIYDIEDMKQALPPLLLIPLVENAFKHGVSETRNQPFVDIRLSVNKRQLSFVVKNSAEALMEEKNHPDGQSGVKENIGLSNLRRQLELLFKDYHLAVKQDGSVFISTLQINLASHV